MAVGVIYFHDVEVENGEGLEHDSIGVRPVGKDSCEGAIKSGEEQLVIKRIVSVVVVESKASDDLSLRQVVAVVVEQVSAQLRKIGIVFGDDEVRREGFVGCGDVVEGRSIAVPALGRRRGGSGRSRSADR